MALDPNISLGVKPVNFGNSMLEGAQAGLKLAQMQQQLRQSEQEIAASQASQALTEAQTPGVAADSEQKQRGLKYINWEMANKKKFVRPDGTVDTNAYVNEASSAGFGDFATKVAATDLSRTADQIKNATSQQEQSIAAADFTAKSLNHTATLLAAAPPEKRPAMLRQYADFAESKVPGAGSQLVQSFGVIDPKTGNMTVDAAKVNATRTATMSALEQANLANAQAQLGLAERSQTLAEQTASIPYKAAVEDITPGSAKVAGLTTAAQGDQYVARLDNGLSAAADKSMEQFLSKPGNMAAAAWNKYVAQNSAAAQLQASIDAYNANHKDATPLTIADGLPAITRILRNEIGVVRNTANVQRGLATKSTISEAAGSGAAAPARSAGDTVPMVNAKGEIFDIPADRVEYFLGRGLKRTK